MKLNWFSPLPPAKSGIAVDFFRTIFPVLARAADLTLWSDQPKWEPALEDQVHVRRFDLKNMPWPELNRADLTFFNLGNDYLFHGSIWEVSRRLPGVVILHDSQLYEFLENWLRDRQLARRDGQPLDAFAKQVESCLAGRVTGARSAHLELALESSLGVVVHTQEAYDQLSAANRWIVAHLPLTFTLPPSWAKKESKQKPAPPYKLIVFGFINRNRRLPALFEALARFPEKNQFRLEIYGKLWDSAFIQTKVSEFGLSDHVHLKGFVSEQKLDDALAAGDLIVNLRYPSLGEASGSQLRIWAHALPSIVTRAGWFATLPETAVAHVDPENEIADIQRHLSAFLQDPESFAQMGRAGKKLLFPTHAPETYVRSLLDLATQVIEYRPRAAAHYFARRAGECMSPWISAVNSDEPLRRAAEQILMLTSPRAATPSHAGNVGE